MKLFITALFFLLLTTPAVTEAATLYLSPNTNEIRPGDTLAIDVRLDTDEGECVNAINGVIEYDPSVQPVDISRGQSILPIWVEDPVIDRANNLVTFAGGIPNGYCGRIDGDPRLTNTILKIIFQAPSFSIGTGAKNATATISFSPESSVLLNDGRGTLAPLVTLDAELFVYDKPGNTVVDEWNTLVTADNQNPQEFSITLNQDDSIFNGKYFIVFNTTDKQTGIDHYEVMEESLDSTNLFGWGAADAPWIKARSPYLLKDQSLNSTIRVKALDKSGNEYIATFVPDESMRQVDTGTYIIYGLLLAAALFLLALVIGIVLKLFRRKKNTDDYEEEEYEEDVELIEDEEDV